MMTLSKGLRAGLLVVAALFLYGCGGGSGSSTGAVAAVSSTGGVAAVSSTTTGRATMSPITNGIVFADRIVAGGSNFIHDGSEVVTTTNASGNYTLAAISYDYLLVSRDGKDSSGADQILMLAPNGSKNITPLTTLVSLDTTGKLAAKLQLLQGGQSFDTDIYINSSQAILVLVKSVEITVQSLTDTFQQASGNTLTRNQVYAIQARIMQKIAAQLVASTRDISVPNNLYLDLKEALNVAIPEVLKENTNISIPAGDVARMIEKVAAGAVDAAANPYTGSATGHLDTATRLGKVCSAATAESTLNSFAAYFKNAQSRIVTDLNDKAVFSIAATATPTGYSVPTFPVVTIPAAVLTGSGGTSGSF